MVGADLNEHVSQGNKVDETELKIDGVKRNPEGKIVKFVKKNEFICGKHFFQKKQKKHCVTYKNVGKSTQMDYIRVKKNLEEI